MSSFIKIARLQDKYQRLLFDALTILGGSFLIAFSAQISIPLLPIPFTLQTFAVLLMGALLGRKKGTLAVLAYLAEGAFGLPVFGGGGAGLAHFTGVTAGYIFGFVLAAYVVGWLLEKGSKERFLPTVIAMMLGSFCIYLLGALWLSLFVGSFKEAIVVGVIPFALSEIAKIMLAATLVPSGRKLRERYSSLL